VSLTILGLSSFACHSAPSGTISGHLYRVGGPAPGLPTPVPGTIDVTGQSAGTKDVTAEAGPDGSFSVEVPVGTYSLRGGSPLIQDGAPGCHARDHQPTVVRAAQTSETDVICDIP